MRSRINRTSTGAVRDPSGRAQALPRQQSRTAAAPVCLILWFLLCFRTFAAERTPPVPDHYFNDYAQVVSTATAARLNQRLEDFERKTSDQILVVIYPKMESDSSIEDYTVRVAQSWKIGQKTRNNGAVLFVFIQDRKMFLQVGYGLEGALPDALAKRIVENEIKPRFRRGDYDGGLTAGVTAILAATQGEYKGTGHTAGDQMGRLPAELIIFVFVALLIALLLMSSRRRTSSGWIMSGGGWGNWGGGGGSNWGGGGGGSWGGGGGGGGGFSAGGGSFGGGGAGGSW